MSIADPENLERGAIKPLSSLSGGGLTPPPHTQLSLKNDKVLLDTMA